MTQKTKTTHGREEAIFLYVGRDGVLYSSPGEGRTAVPLQDLFESSKREAVIEALEEIRVKNCDEYFFRKSKKEITPEMHMYRLQKYIQDRQSKLKQSE